MTAEQMRTEFELWFSDEGTNTRAIQRNGEDYCLMQAQAAWRTWQAAWNRRSTSGAASGEPIHFFRRKAGGDWIKVPSDVIEEYRSTPGSELYEFRTIYAATPPAALPQADERDAALFRQAIALEDNAEILYAAVLNNWPDADAIRREFDAATQPKVPS